MCNLVECIIVSEISGRDRYIFSKMLLIMVEIQNVNKAKNDLLRKMGNYIWCIFVLKSFQFKVLNIVKNV